MKSYNIFEIFFSWENPAIYAVFFVFILLLLLFLIRNEFILPLVKSKRKLELENIKLAALYSEVDPDPIIRIGKNWNLLHMNTAAKTIFEAEEDKFSYLLNQLKSSYADNKNTIIEKIANNYYHIIIKDVPVSDYKHIYFRNITSRIEYEDQILNYQRHLKQLRVRLETSNEEEKQKLGRDLHDGIGHSLSLLKIEVQNYIKIKSLNIEEEEAMRLLNSIDVLTGEVRDLSHELRPRILEECGLVQAINSQIAIRNSIKKSKGEVTQNVEFRITDNKLELNLYRVCQEAIKNLNKHSRCNSYFIDFYKDGKNLEITIIDDGIGFDVEKELINNNGSLGLFNMKERIETAGGTFEIISLPKSGTTVFINIEINEGKKND